MSARVLHLVWRLSAGGGKPQVVRQILGGLQEGRHEVHLCSIRPFFPEDPIDELPRHVHRHSLGMEGPRTPLQRLRIAWRTRALIHRIRPDLIHIHQGLHWYTLPAQIGARVPELLDIHDAPSRMKSSRLSRVVSGALVRGLPYTLVAHSSSVRRELCDEWSVRPGRVDVVPLGIATASYRTVSGDAASWRTRNGVPLGAPVVVYVARMVRSKNVPLFLEVARLVSREAPGAVFLVVGQGPELDGLRAMAGQMELDGTVRFLGFRDDLVDILQASDVFLSTSSYEGFGLAILEAAAAGLPVVSTRVGGVTDVMEEGVTGLLAAPDDAEGLASATLALLRDDGARWRMGATGQERAERLFDAGLMAVRYQEIYDRMVAGAGPRSARALSSPSRVPSASGRPEATNALFTWVQAAHPATPAPGVAAGQGHPHDRSPTP